MTANQRTLLRSDINSLDFLYDQHTVKVLESAANSFIKHQAGTVKIWAASRDWFLEEWGRDSFIAFAWVVASHKTL